MNKNNVWNIAWIFLAIGLTISLIIFAALLLTPEASAFKGTGTTYEAGRTSQGVSGNTGTSAGWLSRFTGTANQAGNLNAFNSLFNLIVGWFGALIGYDFTITSANITYAPASINEQDPATIYANIYNLQTANATDVNITFYINDVLQGSNLINIAGASNTSTAFAWTAQPGFYQNITIKIDEAYDFVETNKNNNNASTQINVSRIALINITRPLNNSVFARGNDTGTEDYEGIISNFMTAYATAYSKYNYSQHPKLNCTFYFNGTYIGKNETNTTGACVYNFAKLQVYGRYNLTVNITDLPFDYYTNSTINYDAIKVNISIYVAVLTADNLRPNGKYKVGDIARLNISITRDGTPYDPQSILAQARTSSETIVSQHYYPGDIVRTGIGEYYALSPITTAYSDGGWLIHWRVYVNDTNITVSDSSVADVGIAADAVHADVGIDQSDTNITIRPKNSTYFVLDANVSIYDKAGYLLQNKKTSESDPELSRAASRYDTYTINITADSSEQIIINSLNATQANTTLSPQFYANYTGAKPTLSKNFSTIIAINETITIQNATITLLKNGLNISKICRCTSWNINFCEASWECNATTDYSYASDAASFTFTAYEFSAYAGSEEYGSNLTIFDDTDAQKESQTKYISDQVGFYANYSYSNGTAISTGSCEIKFNTTGTWTDYTAMAYNSTSKFFEYNRTFDSKGTHYWNASCTGYGNLTAQDTVTISDNSPVQRTPKTGAHHPYTGNTKDANLMAYWQFEKGSNKTGIAIDSAGMNNLTIYGGVIFTDEGAIGSAYEFNSDDDYMEKTISGAVIQNYTVSFWIYLLDSAKPLILRLGGTSFYVSWNNQFRVVDFNLSANTAGGYFGSSFATDYVNKWTHVVFTRTGGTLNAYTDGILNATTTSSGLSTTSPTLRIGNIFAGRNFNGTIDQVMIYNRSLTAAEIYEMYLDGRINSSSTVSTDQDLGASAVNQTDVNNDVIKNIFNWYRNETSISLLNMPFEGGSNTTWTRDYSPYGNNGTVVGATYNATGGVDGRGAYQFDGNQYINITSNTYLNPTDEITITAWIKASRWQTNYWEGTIAGKDDWASGAHGYVLRTGQDGILSFVIGNGTDWLESMTGSLMQNTTWYHVAGTFNKTTIKTYIDGREKSATNLSSTTINGSQFNLGIAKDSYAPDRRFNGTIDEVQIFNRSLTQEQIFSLYMLEHNRIVSNETIVGDTWKCCITPNDGTSDGITYCSNNVTITNGKPTAPVLLTPYNSTTITNRTPEFAWTNSIDADSETLTYELLLSDEIAFAAPVMNITGIPQGSGTNTSYVNNTDLALDKQYYWRARAWDGTQYSDWSAMFNFTLESFLAVSLTVNSTNFGTMSPWDTNDTSDDNPNPLLMENIGNIRANVTITGTQLFTLGGFPSEYYQFKIGLNETSSFDQTQSTMNYTNMTETSSRIDTAILDWHNENDTAELDINVTVPAHEPKGAKSSLITITVS